MLKFNQTIISVIEENARKCPTHIAYRFLNDALAETDKCTYSDLITQAKHIASYLVSKSAQKQRILLMFNPNLEFIIAFFACMYASCIPIPCYSARIVGKNLSRSRSIIEDADPRFLLTDEHLNGKVTELVHPRHIENALLLYSKAT